MARTEPAALTIPGLLRHSVQRFGPRRAISDGEVRMTFRRLAAAAEFISRATMTAGIEPGDRVALWAPHSRRWIVSALGLLDAGAVLVPIDVRLRGRHVRDVLEASGARLLMIDRGSPGSAPISGPGAAPIPVETIVDMSDGPHDDRCAAVGWAEFLDGTDRTTRAAARERAAAVRPEDLSEIMFSVRARGVDGVAVSHRAGVMLHVAVMREWGLREGDRYLITPPPPHTGGSKAAMMAGLICGVTMVPLAAFDAVTAMATIERERITVMNGSPAIYAAILDHPRRHEFDLRSLRTGAVDACETSVELLQRARGELSFDRLFSAYRPAGFGGVVAMTRCHDTATTVATTRGSALPGIEIAVVGPDGSARSAGSSGEVLVRGLGIATRRWPEAGSVVDADGWLHTGDSGHLDEHGNLSITRAAVAH